MHITTFYGTSVYRSRDDYFLGIFQRYMRYRVLVHVTIAPHEQITVDNRALRAQLYAVRNAVGFELT